MATILTTKAAEQFLRDLGISYRYTFTCSNTIICKIKRDDAQTLINMLKEETLQARYSS